MCNITFPKEYKGFDLISITEIPDCTSTGIYLRHKKTGLEVFHLVNNDEENLFSFSFRTPIKDSTGAAHILEHSVFCGSEKFPLKEPFTNIMNQSVNTFLNALTYSDKTVYPSSSMIKSDYYNLMDVYADAVFFPLLKKEAFMQEAHRLEINEKGKYEIQGVVYNEMKGNYSSFESVAADEQLRSLYPDTNYSFDSGGDPLVIPSFSYEDFKNFHNKYYRPDNCLLFLYGNIDTKSQLDFLQEHLLNRLEKKFTQPIEHEKYPFVDPNFIKIENQKKFDGPIKISKIAPDAGATGSTATINWLCGKTSDLQSYIECAFLSEVLTGHDGSPITKALIDSDLGDDIAPITGCINESYQFSIAIGLHGIKPKNEKKVYALIFSELEKLYKEGIDKRDLESAIMSAEFSNREVIRAGGPYSITLLERTLNAWNYGEEPSKGLFYINAFENIKKNIENDSKYIEKLIYKYLLSNKNCSFVIVNPSKLYLKERTKKENRYISTIAKKVNKDEVKKELEKLHKYQQHHESTEEISCIPKLNIKDLSTDIESINTDFSFINFDNTKISLFKNEESTNGIVYFEVHIPVDNLSAEDYKYLPLYSYCTTNVGWNGKNWAECAEDTALYTGGITCRLFTSNSPNTNESIELKKKLSSYNFVDRDWIIFSVRMISEKIDQALDLFAECIKTFNFKDTKRLSTLISEVQSSIKANVIPHGNKLASTRAQCLKTHSGTVEEIWRGITQLFAINKIATEKTTSLASHFEKITDFLKEQGYIFHITTDKDTMNLVIPKIENFAKKIGIKSLTQKKEKDESKFKSMILLPGQKTVENLETFTVSAQVGYAATSINSSYFGSEENPSELILSHYLSGTSLWEKIRTTGGAYGAYAGCANLSGLFVLSTFRDPLPQKSIQVFIECLKNASIDEIDEDELSRMITGTYGDEVQPHSPHGRGNVGFIRTIYCISEKDRKDKLVRLLNTTPKQLKEIAKKIYENSATGRSVILCNKFIKKTGIIIDLPL